MQDNHNSSQSGSLPDSEVEEDTTANVLQDNYDCMQSGSLPESEAEEEDEVANCLQDNHFTQSGSLTDSEVVLLSAQENATLDHLASDVYDRIIKGFNKIRDLMKEPES